MQLKISHQKALFIFCVAGAAVALAAVFVLVSAPLGKGSYAQPVLSASPDPEQARSGLPIRLLIPKINVDAAVEHLGLAPDGTMAVPSGPKDAAWFDLGPRPGENGSAVIAGHEGWKNGIPAAFGRLYLLRKGDKIYVKDAKGATAIFVVRDERTYDQNGDASGVFGSSDGKSHLNLITCEGAWDALQKSYSNRLVVFADKETE
jgi:LPXTG-site transpeptidase (sortase) family protein